MDHTAQYQTQFKGVFVMVILLMLILMAHVSVAQSSHLVTYPPPQQILYTMHNDDYTVMVRQVGGEWKDLYEYKVLVDADRVAEASMVHFDFSGTIEVMVKKNNGIVHGVTIRPKVLGINPHVKGNIITFTLNKPMKFSVEFNNDGLNNLHVFARDIEYSRVDKTDPNVIYFGPGLHQPKDGKAEYEIPSGKTVFLDGGAVVKAKFVTDSAKNVIIRGSGIVLNAERGVEARWSENVRVEGIIFINPTHYTFFGGASNGITIKDIMSFSCKGWSDGLDFMSCSNVTVDGVFMRNSDDCVAIYGHRWEYYGNAKNYTISNSVLWADVAHPTNIGTHGNSTDAGDTIANILFKNIDILEHDEDDRNYQGCLAISATDKNLVQDITYEDIRIDNIQEGQILNFRVYFNEKYSSAPGRSIRNVVVKNVSYVGDRVNPSLVHGYNKEQIVDGLVIQNLRVNGSLVTKAAADVLEIGSFVTGIRFLK
jgi:hypothetical protein